MLKIFNEFEKKSYEKFRYDDIAIRKLIQLLCSIHNYGIAVICMNIASSVKVERANILHTDSLLFYKEWYGIKLRFQPVAQGPNDRFEIDKKKNWGKRKSPS